MTEVRSMPCEACPYRRDAPSGIWAADEYERLRAYDAPTFAQPPRGFACHASPDFYCDGWAVVHSSRGHEHELLALRLCSPAGGIPSASRVALFDSGAAAAEHGLADVDEPGEEARAMARRLMRKHGRLSECDCRQWSG